MKLHPLAALLMFCASAAYAQFPKAPGHAHLTRLEPLMGAAWEGRMQTPQGEAVETYRYDWMANGAFVLFTHTMSFGAAASHTEYAVIGWDPEAEKLRYWGFLADGSFFDGHETETEEDEIVAFDVAFTGSSFIDRAELSMGLLNDGVLFHRMSMALDEGREQSFESTFKRVELGANNNNNNNNNNNADRQASKAGDYAVGVHTIEARPILSVRTKTTPDQIGPTLGRLYGRIGAHMSRAGAAFAGQPLAIYHAYSDEEVDLEAAVPVNKEVAGAGDVKAGHLPSGKVVKLDFYGPYDDLPKGHAAIDAFLAENNLTQAGPPWEVYITDPTTEPDSSKWKTEIYYPVR